MGVKTKKSGKAAWKEDLPKKVKTKRPPKSKSKGAAWKDDLPKKKKTERPKRKKGKSAAWKSGSSLLVLPSPSITSWEVTNQRTTLKFTLMIDRGELTMAGYRPICPVCKEPTLAPDMNEAILTRGDVQGAPIEVQAMIYARENCVLVHGKCHTHAIKDVCILQLLEKEGFCTIMAWLAKFVDLLPRGLINERRNRIGMLYQGGTHDQE